MTRNSKRLTVSVLSGVVRIHLFGAVMIETRKFVEFGDVLISQKVGRNEGRQSFRSVPKPMFKRSLPVETPCALVPFLHAPGP